MNKQVSAELGAPWVGIYNDWEAPRPINERLLCSCLQSSRAPLTGRWVSTLLGPWHCWELQLWACGSSGRQGASPAPPRSQTMTTDTFSRSMVRPTRRPGRRWGFCSHGCTPPFPASTIHSQDSPPNPSPTRSRLISSCEQSPLSSSTSPTEPS